MRWIIIFRDISNLVKSVGHPGFKNIFSNIFDLNDSGHGKTSKKKICSNPRLAPSLFRHL